MVSPKIENGHQFNKIPNNAASSLRACLVDGDAEQLARDRRLRRRSLLLSSVAQIAVLAVLILVPILSKTERIALANVMPMPPYRPAAGPDRAPAHPHHAPHLQTFSFCLNCPPVIPRSPMTNNSTSGDSLVENNSEPNTPGIDCPDCTGLIANYRPQPAISSAPTTTIVHVGHLDPAMLIHRVEPVFPTLAKQTRREGTVKFHAIIATDGSVQSLQFLEGDPLFKQSALDAVRQWRYKPTVLNGRPVEVDTHITVIYRLNL